MAAPRKSRLRAALLPAVLLALALAGPPGRAQTPAEDQGLLAGFLSRLLSTPTSRVSIGAVDGALSSDATIRNVAVADDAGVYLTIDRIRIDWRRTALLQRRIEVERLEIGRIVLARRPAAVSGEPEPGPILPELPLALRVGAFTLGELALGQAVLGAPARLAARGSASLGAPAEGLRANLTVNRLDAPGAAQIALVFVPQGETLDLNVQLDEPAGGLLARLAGIPGEPPVRLDLRGNGALDDWRARLAFEGGPDLSAAGAARLARTGPARLLTLDVSGRLAPLLPAIAAPIFAGVTSLTGEVAFPDAGGVDLKGLRLAAPLAELTAAGSLSADRALDLRISARALPNAGEATEAGQGRLARLNFEGRATGQMTAPRVEGDLDLAGLATPTLSLDALTGRFALTPAPAAANEPVRAAFEANASARGLRLADAALSQAIGRDLTLALAGRIEGVVATFATARLSSPTLALDYEGRLGRRVLDGAARARILDLAAFSALAGRTLRGQARMEARLTGDPARPDIGAQLTGEASALSLGDGRLDRLVGPSPRLAGGLRLRDGALRLERVRLAGRALSGDLDGSLSEPALDLAATLTLSDLAALDSRLGGQATLRGRLTGPSGDPDAALALAAPEITALGRPIRGLTASLDARRLATAPDLAVTARGDVDGKPLTLDGRASRAGGGWSVERLAGAVGSVAVEASGRLNADGLLAGRASVQAGDLGDVSALALAKLSGRLSAILEARSDGGRQFLSVLASGEGIATPAVSARTLAADLKAEDLYGRPVIRGAARLAELAVAGQRFETLALGAEDGGDGASAITLAGRGGGFDLTGAALVRPGPPTTIRLDAFRAARNGRAVALAGPASFVLGEGGARTDGLALDIGGGRLSLAGLLGQTLDLSARWSGIPLAAAAIVAPGLDLSGVTEGQAALTGPAAAPRGPVTLLVRGLSHPALRAAGAPALDVAAKGDLRGQEASIDATIRGGRAIDLTVGGTAAFAETGPLDLTARGTVDTALANARLAGSGQRVAGRVTIDARAGGTRAAPRLSGSATLAGGSFRDLARGVAIEG